VNILLMRVPPAIQSKPPCGHGETELNGACWVEAAKEKPPCDPKHSEYEERCYSAPIDTSRRKPNSIQP
jgi:hypothetical protein